MTESFSSLALRVPTLNPIKILHDLVLLDSKHEDFIIAFAAHEDHKLYLNTIWRMLGYMVIEGKLFKYTEECQEVKDLLASKTGGAAPPGASEGMKAAAETIRQYGNRKQQRRQQNNIQRGSSNPHPCPAAVPVKKATAAPGAGSQSTSSGDSQDS